jgi:hypothetical protein
MADDRAELRERLTSMHLAEDLGQQQLPSAHLHIDQFLNAGPVL